MKNDTTSESLLNSVVSSTSSNGELSGEHLNSTLDHEISSKVYRLDPMGRSRVEVIGLNHVESKAKVKFEQISHQTVSIKYNCYSTEGLVGTVSIWWGFTDVDGTWACNTNIPACKNNCVVNRNSRYQCKNSNGKVEDWVDIWWGFTSVDGKWACTNWVNACKQGTCAAILFPQNFWFSNNPQFWSDADKVKR